MMHMSILYFIIFIITLIATTVAIVKISGGISGLLEFLLVDLLGIGVILYLVGNMIISMLLVFLLCNLSGETTQTSLVRNLEVGKDCTLNLQDNETSIVLKNAIDGKDKISLNEIERITIGEQEEIQIEKITERTQLNIIGIKFYEDNVHYNMRLPYEIGLHLIPPN